MTTIIVHGTKLFAGAQHTSWWHDSWHEGGFLHALARGMETADGWEDVWTVNGIHVSEIPDLSPKWSPWTGRSGQVSAHNGHFIWSGADMGIGRDVGGDQLADYLNVIARLTDEPIRIIGYSHGCNVVKGATTSRRLGNDVWIDACVFLAGPHFHAESAGRMIFTYRLDPARVGRVLNLYSEQDGVQVGFAEAVTGPAGARWRDWIPPESSRIDLDPDAAHLYEDYELPLDPSIGEIHAHTVVHGALAGFVSGLWLNGYGTMADVEDAFGGALPPITPDDDGS